KPASPTAAVARSPMSSSPAMASRFWMRSCPSRRNTPFLPRIPQFARQASPAGQKPCQAIPEQIRPSPEAQSPRLRLFPFGSGNPYVPGQLLLTDRLQESTMQMGTGIAIGVAIGTAIGVAMDNIAMGIGIGIALGIALAGAWGAYKGDGSKD